MPSRRQLLLDVSQPQGLSITGPLTGTPPNFLRRARGIQETCINEYRLAQGDTLLHLLPGGTPIHSIARFNDKRYYGAGGILYEEGTAILSGLNGNPLALLRLPTGNAQPDELFIAGGGLLRKVSTTSAVTQWGIDPPADGMTASLVAQSVKTIENFENSADFTVTPGTVTKATESTIQQDGNSLKLTIPPDTLASATKAITVDLSQFTTSGDSSNEDLIELWLRIDGTSRAFAYCTLRFDVGAGDFSSDYYQYKILPTLVTVNTMDLRGVGSEPPVQDDEQQFIDQGSNQDSGGDDGGASTSAATWSRVRIAKSSFLRSGNGSGTWANVAGIQLMIATTFEGTIDVYADFCRMRGGAGMRGDYQSLVTFDNTTTGARSNSNPTPVLTRQNDRQKIAYASIPLSSDPQVNARTLWRTMGDGAQFFREAVIPDNTTTTYTSSVADIVGLWSIAAAPLLSLPVLPTDNARPLDTHIDFIYDQATVFWISGGTGTKGRVFYSPAGRPEAQSGFIQVCQDDIPLFRIIVWQRARYAVGEAGWFRIDGTSPFTVFKFEGIPGLTQAQARTLVPTPFGIIWQAQDGLRVFNGAQSDFLHYPRIGPLFRNEGGEGLTLLLGICAGYARGQYFISDGAQTISINLSSGLIRDLGKGYTALYYEEDTRLLLGADDTGLVIVEGDTTATQHPFIIATPAYLFPDNTIGYVDQLFVDLSLQVAAPSLILDATGLALAPLAPVGRQLLERQVGYPCRLVALTLAGQDLSGFGLYGAECAVRDLSLELTLMPMQGTQDGQVILSLRARSSDLTHSIYFQVLEDQRQTEPFESCLIAYTFTIDADTNTATIIPVLHFMEGDVTLGSMSSTNRTILQWFPHAMGHLTGVSLLGNFMTPITLYRVELEMRPVTLELVVLNLDGAQSGQTLLSLKARSTDLRTGMYFAILESTRDKEPFDAALLVARFTLDAVLATRSITPTLHYLEGDRVLAPMTNTTRGVLFATPRLPGHLLGITLAGDFTFPVTLHRVECEMRPVTLEILTLDHTLKLTGRTPDTRSGFYFEVTEQMRTSEPFDQTLQVQHFLLDCGLGSVQPSIGFEEGSLSLVPISFPVRTLSRTYLQRLGHLTNVTLLGNFFTETTYYRAALELRPCVLSLFVNGQRLPHQARVHITGPGLHFEIPDQLFLSVAPSQQMLVKRLILDMDTNGQEVTPTLVTDKGTRDLPPIQEATRAWREWALGLPGRPRQLVLHCDVTLIRTLYEAELHCYVAGGPHDSLQVQWHQAGG